MTTTRTRWDYDPEATGAPNELESLWDYDAGDGSFTAWDEGPDASAVRRLVLSLPSRHIVAALPARTRVTSYPEG